MYLTKKTKTVLFIVGIILGITLVVFKYSMQPPVAIEAKKVAFEGVASDLLIKVQQNSIFWQDKVVVVTGEITSIDPNGMTMDKQLYGQFKNQHCH